MESVWADFASIEDDGVIWVDVPAPQTFTVQEGKSVLLWDRDGNRCMAVVTSRDDFGATCCIIWSTWQSVVVSLPPGRSFASPRAFGPASLTA